MAEFLRIQPQVPRLDPGQLRVPPLGGAYLGRGLEELGATIERVEDGAARAEATRSVLDGQAEFDAGVQNLDDTITDPTEFREKAGLQVQDLYQSRIERASTHRARALIENQLSNDLIKTNRQITHRYNLKTKEKAEGDFVVAENTLINSAIGADEEKRKSTGRIYGRLIADMTRNGFIKPDKAAAKLIDFDRKVTLGTLQTMEPNEFISRQLSGEFNKLPAVLQDEIMKIGESMRKRIEHDQNRQTEIFNKLKSIDVNNINAAANRGDISNAEMEDMLAGRHPYVTAVEARRIKEVNDSPPMAEGNDNVDAIMEEYKSGPSNFQRIARARAEINLLRKNQAKRNPAIAKALDELQTDERTMTGIATTGTYLNLREINEKIKSAENEYIINNPRPPIKIPGLENKEKREKAQIQEDIKKGRDPQKRIDNASKSTKAAEERARQKHGAALDYQPR